MALTLMPDGKTFKKLNAAQEKALKSYYNRLHDKPLTETLGLPFGLMVLGGIGALAYIFKEEIKKAFDEQEKALVDWIKGLPVEAGGLVADVIIKAEDTLFPQNPVNPEFVQLPPFVNRDGTTTERPPTQFTRCQRWELDANDWHKLAYDSGPLTKTEMTLAALTAARIIKNMKKEGCPRPSAFSQAQWDDI